MRRRFIPIRIKIMISLLTVTTAVVSVITFTMANLFQQDKKAYINDLAAIVALNTAEESRALLAGYRDRLEAWRETPVTTLIVGSPQPEALRVLAELEL